MNKIDPKNGLKTAILGPKILSIDLKIRRYVLWKCISFRQSMGDAHNVYHKRNIMDKWEDKRN